MRVFITILFLICSLFASATKYYVSAAGNDAAAGNSTATAWQTIAKVNSFFISMLPGDSVLFRRGDTFTGGIVISRSGSVGNHIGFGGYGTGPKPIISGFVTLSGWSLVSGSIYETSLNTGLRLNLLTVDGVIKAPGRYPNFNASNGGYLPITAHTPIAAPHQYEPSTITVATLTGSWVGADLVNRKNYYTFDREMITGQSGTTLNYTSPSAQEQENGFGIFIQHHAATLDTLNEWYYNSDANTIRIYGNPAGKVVKAATVESLVTINNKSYIGFRDLYFTGSDTAVFNITGGSGNIRIINCDMIYNGIEGITVPQFDNCNNIFIDSCLINWINSYPILLYGASNITVQNTVIKNCNTIPGLPRAGQSGYGAIYVDGGDNYLFEYNTIDTCGGTALAFAGGNNIVASHNYINYYNLIMSDGAGIYTHSPYATARRIHKNIVTNGVGSWHGTPGTVNRASSGIYLDEWCRDVLVDSNTVYKMVANGIYIHQSFDLIFRGNTIYDNQYSGIQATDDEPWAHRVRNITIKGNYIFAKTPTQVVIGFQSLADDLDSFTNANAIDSNYYARPFSDAGFLETSYQDSGSTIKTYYDVPGWNNKYGWGGHSIVFPLQINEYKFNSNIGSNIFTNPSFTSTTAGVTAGTGSAVGLESGKLDGNALKASSVVGSDIPFLNTGIHFGSLLPGKYYKLTFSLIGSTNTANLQIYFIGDNDYVTFGSPYYFPLRTTRVECEAYFYTNTGKADATCVLQSREPLFPYWIDNVVLQEINATPVNISDSVRLEYNPTKVVKVVNLVNTYKDPKGVMYPGSITLQPYSSAILRYVSAPASNASPTASVITPISIALPTSSVMLNGTGSSDSDGTIASYAWTRLSGPGGYSIDNAGISTPTVSGLTAGTHVFRLTVVDDDGASSTANATVTVSAAQTNFFRLNGIVIFK